jgi:hypothetical protein
MNGMPITVNQTVNTSPLFPEGKSPGARWTVPTNESGKVAANCTDLLFPLSELNNKPIRISYLSTK